jgi:hypothetical protein
LSEEDSKAQKLEANIRLEELRKKIRQFSETFDFASAIDELPGRINIWKKSPPSN